MSKKSRGKAWIPKRVGGVKVPKKLRKAGAMIAAAAASPAGLELIAAGLRVASKVASAAGEKGRGDRPAAAKASGDAPTTGPAPTRSARDVPPRPAGNDPHEIGVALGKMAEAALAGLFKPKP